MYFKKTLKKLGTVFFALLLFGCTFSNSLQTENINTTKNSDKKHSTGRHHYGNTRADNPATQDYFDRQANNSHKANHDNLWVDMRKNFQINHDENNPQVQAQIAWFVHNQGYLDRTARRAAPFMYYIYQEVKKRHLPAELVLLPIIESAYNPFTSSPAGAVGLWQIVPGTGRDFGLRQNFWYDGRRDIKTSTMAALNYLAYLENFFAGNWLLAIAAYDTGQGNVASAIRRNARAGLSTDFWSLRLARETQAYIPRLLALAIIINDPSRFNIHLPPISNAPYLGEVAMDSTITLEKAATLTGMNLEELKILNAGIRKSKFSPAKPYHLLVPIDHISELKSNLSTINANTNISSETNPEINTSTVDAPNLSDATSLDKPAMQQIEKIEKKQYQHSTHSRQKTKIKAKKSNRSRHIKKNSHPSTKLALAKTPHKASAEFKKHAISKSTKSTKGKTHVHH